MTTRLAPETRGKSEGAHLWLRAGRYSLFLERRPTYLAALLAFLVLFLAIYGMGVGGSSLTHRDVLEVLSGHGTDGQHLIIWQWRLPRVLAAIAVGVALGVSGSIFQTLTQNPLGSPDLIGFTMGSQTGILVAILMMGSSLASITVFSLVGGLASGLLIYLLAARGGFGRMRLILCGIAISSMLGSLNRWLIVQADSDAAYGAMKAVTGTLAKVSWEIAVPCIIGIGATLLATLLCQRTLNLLLLGPELSTVLGVRLTLCQGVLVLLGVALVAFSTIIAGPISFIALLAPHIARSLCRTPQAPLLASGFVGALLLLGADLLSQSLFENLPVGIVTAAIGGFYFMALLVMEARKTSVRTL